MEVSSRGLLHVKEGHIRWTNNETFELQAEGVIIMKTSDNQYRNSSVFSRGRLRGVHSTWDGLTTVQAM